MASLTNPLLAALLPAVLMLFPGGCSRRDPGGGFRPAAAPARAVARAAERARPRGVDGYSEAAWAQREAQMARKLGPSFTMVRAHPFLVAGDGPASRVRAYAESTVRWAARHLKRRYFPLDPPRIVAVYLFQGSASYQRHVRDLFGGPPSTPFGYYDSERGALVMDISTGGGTLVHEMVHPFMAANFPGCPAWFNEGLGSLYEQCDERDGVIWGLPNWRLTGLKRAIQDGKLPSFKKLTHMSQEQFYGAGSGLSYAQARYLCLYLQEEGLLERFYREFRASSSAGRDRSGYKTLLAVLGLSEAEMPAFQRRWEAWVGTLRFP